mmetsp:Transcript_3598/g.4460  ORF Transcript_3598/g.4460 Transcript_3598/m.4460 type:complete len:85 (+) Transcript_3598:376-630(+)
MSGKPTGGLERMQEPRVCFQDFHVTPCSGAKRALWTDQRTGGSNLAAEIQHFLCQSRHCVDLLLVGSGCGHAKLGVAAIQCPCT